MTPELLYQYLRNNPVPNEEILASFEVCEYLKDAKPMQLFAMYKNDPVLPTDPSTHFFRRFLLFWENQWWSPQGQVLMPEIEERIRSYFRSHFQGHLDYPANEDALKNIIFTIEESSPKTVRVPDFSKKELKWLFDFKSFAETHTLQESLPQAPSIKKPTTRL